MKDPLTNNTTGITIGRVETGKCVNSQLLNLGYTSGISGLGGTFLQVCIYNRTENNTVSNVTTTPECINLRKKLKTWTRLSEGY